MDAAMEGLPVTLHQIDRFFGKFYSRRNRHTTLPTTTRPRLHNRRPRNSFAQISAYIRRLDYLPEIAYPTTRRRTIISRRTSSRIMTAVASQPESSMHIHRRPDHAESSISNHMVRNYAEISSARERFNDLDENCPLIDWVRTDGIPAPNSLVRETISDLPENVPRIQKVVNLPYPTETSRGCDRVGSQVDKCLQLDSVSDFDLADNCPLIQWIRNLKVACPVDNNSISHKMQRVEQKRAKNTTKKKIARAKQTSEQHASTQSINSARRKAARICQTSEQREAHRRLDTARRGLARGLQMDAVRHSLIRESVEHGRSTNTAKKKRTRAKQTSSQHASTQSINSAIRKDARIGETSKHRDANRRLDTARKGLARGLHMDGVQNSRQSRRRLAFVRQNPVERVVQNSLNAFRSRVVGQRLARQTIARQRVVIARQIVISQNVLHQRLPGIQLMVCEDNIRENTYLPPTTDDYIPLSNAQVFRKSCNDISWVSCPLCKRKFPDLKISAGICTSCKLEKRDNTNAGMFSVNNSMDPGIVPLELSRLSNLERILIARVHPMMSVYRVRGQQYKYSGNVINFSQDVNLIATVLPFKPADLSAILVVNRGGPHASKEFRVRREFVRTALVWLKTYNRYYNDIIIDDGTIEGLPLDGQPDDLPHMSRPVEDIDNEVSAIPREADDDDGPPDLYNQDLHIDEFHAVGTISIAAQPNQQARLRRAFMVPNVDQTNVHMPLTTHIIDEFSTPGYIVMAFPTLFPYGEADLRQARQRKVNPLPYFQFLMKYHDERFARDTRFRYFAWNSLSRWQALSLGDVFVRKNPGDAELSIEEIRNMISSGDKQLANRVSYYANNIRGTRCYWYTRLKELTAMVKQLGAPTIFFTLSAADMQWPELFRILDPSNDLERMSLLDKRRGRAKLINDNPNVVAWFFQARVEFFFRDYLRYEFSVVDHWYRFEWQNRGSGHVHGFLWLADAPDVTKIATSAIDRSNVIDYFDRLVCTVNPDPSMSRNLQEHPCARILPLDLQLDTNEDDYVSLVNWVMRHSICGSHCLRLHKATKQMVCRFRYPFDVIGQSKIVEEPPNSNMYRFLGRRNDELVCSHNRKILQTWRANIDWSPVLSVQSVVNYIAKYAAKSEPASKSFRDTLQDIVEDFHRPCQNARSAFKRLLMKSVSERDISAQEVCHLLMGYPLTRSSRKFVLLNVSEKSMLASIVRRRTVADEDEIVGTDPTFVGRYLQRPFCYENISLLNMAKRHYFKQHVWHTSRVDAVVRLVPELDGNILPNTEKWESFCRQQVLIHHHYRTLEEARGEFPLWSERYYDLGFEITHGIILPEPIDEELEDGIEVELGTEDLLRDEWMMAAAMGPMFVPGETVELGRRDFDISHNWAEGLHRYPNIEIDRKFVHALRGGNELNHEPQTVVPDHDLSNEQRLAHDMVVRALQAGACIRLIVCGGAGTGKSTLINAIVYSVTAIFKTNKAVRVMAPTGVAAFNIGGATIHHELSFTVDQKGVKQTSKNIEGDQCRRMQEDFKDTKLIIIDEYSMVGRSMLANIDRRCRDIFAKNDPFGDVSIILVGDMRQLPPVCDSALYVQGGSIQKQHGGIVYSSFDKCVRLSHIFRQAGDDQASFRETLFRLSNGTSTVSDWQLFLTRDISSLNMDEVNTFKDALRLFPTKQPAHDYNLTRLIELGKPVARIVSLNNCETATKASSDDAKGLEKVLCLSLGARVMLRSNIATTNGLVNGAMGTVVDIVYGNGCKSPEDIPLAVMVDFDHYRGARFRPDSNTIPITPQTSNWKSGNTSCQRIQVPLVLCWAITIHKSQGLTLDRAVVDIGERESLGLTFVALSRTRKLCDLAFCPMFSLERLQKIGKCVGLRGRLQEENRLLHLSASTI